MKFKVFTGGMFETNCYLFDAPGGAILFDAPEGSCEWLKRSGVEPKLLLLTHGHYDHIQDVAKIKRAFSCPVGCHQDTAPMIANPHFFRDYGFALEVETAAPDFLIEPSAGREFLGETFAVFDVPGHCPGSLCFLSRAERVLVGGDVLFAGGVGRWDLPGGDAELLFRGIKEKLYSLPEQTTVLPGHGPLTTVGKERATNPFVR